VFLLWISGGLTFGSDGGGKRLWIPISVLIEDTNKKKVSNKNDMSDIDEALRPGSFFLFLAIIISYFIFLEISANKTDIITPANKV
jgi:hypothetical protein